jgi:hypothetical protein
MPNDAVTILNSFAEAACAKPLADRITSLLSSELGRKKFLDMLSHKFAVREELATSFADASPVPEGSCFIFSDGIRVAFGETSPSFADALKRVNPMGAWLLISSSGRVGVYQPETFIDDRVLIRVPGDGREA